MNRLLLLPLALAAGIVAARCAALALASDESKIERLVRRMEEGYDEADASQATSGLAPDWIHADYRQLDRTTLRQYLFYDATNERDPETKAYRNRVDVPEEDLSITVDGDRATLDCTAHFSHLKKGEWEENWVARVHAELERRNDGWRIVRSEHEDLKGRGPR